jgi:hypothetical protein
MICPFCQTENRDEREKCYACDKDISMLRLVVNKARHHYNLALEHAERGRIVQAIDELHHALDLDKSFIPAHVVLGTLHAKQNEFAKAREAWEAALELSPELTKAHNYLERVHVAESSLPVVRQLRWLAGALAVLSFVLATVLVWSLRPDPAQAPLHAAQVAYRQGQYGESLRQLVKAQAAQSRSHDVRLAATSLQATIESDLRQQVRVIQDLKLHEDFPAALSAIRQLEARGPDLETSAALAVIKTDINHYYQRKLEEFADQFNNGDLPYEQFAERAEEFLNAYPDSAEKDTLRSYLAKARETEVERKFAQIRTGYDATRDFRVALDALQALAAENPGSEIVKKGRAELVEEILSNLSENFSTCIEKRDFETARGILQQINDLADEFRDVVNVSGPAQLAARVLKDTERAERLRRVENLMERNEFTDAQELLGELRKDELTSAELELVDTFAADLTHRVAQNEVEELRKDEEKYLKLQVTDEVASTTLAGYASLLDRLPRTDTASRARTMAYAAASALKLGERARAEELLGLLEKEERSSPMVKSLQAQLKKKPR